MPYNGQNQPQVPTPQQLAAQQQNQGSGKKPYSPNKNGRFEKKGKKSGSYEKRYVSKQKNDKDESAPKGAEKSISPKKLEINPSQ